jgi:hypothetical protein
MVEATAIAAAAAGAGADHPPPAPRVASPSEELGLVVCWGAALLYWAESGANPAVRSYWDGLHYVSTALSVGYANIFPVTPLGKMIGAVVMTVGPALSARALDQGQRGGSSDGDGGGTAILAEKLDAILTELRKNGAR